MVLVVFAAAAVAACGLTDPDRPRRTLDVAAHKAVCAGPFHRFCLRVREPGATEWTFLYDTPRGFDFEWGVATRIVVEEREIRDPPPDGSSTERTVVRVVSRETLPPGSRFTLLVPGGTTGEEGEGVHRFDFGAEAMRCVDGPDCDGLARVLRGNDAVDVTLELGAEPDDPFRVVDWRSCGQPWPICE